ncbi:hypothetical protein ADK67_24735 [Saccharothrix sp. NRRL B-16348]|uniref:hypothetical protein n=1 Tax=Saccharothrix sp. NRRL B-16348 TaxID=1415542 RepID=UPI0006AEA9E5|nr:hypothetical protein [Saccharothrix sp. NRRL B-16348]KOX21887.1 hypothetical protein ADK67_24735 [Saccharothrix sp. NRRL B-16348]
MGPLSDDEYRTFFTLLHRFCEEELDQAEQFSVPTRFGDVYAHFSRDPLGPADAYTPLGDTKFWNPSGGPAREPGRPRL